MDEDLATARAEFIELMGLAMEAEGMPRIAGRIVGLLMFEDRPYSFSEIANELKISRGSVSSNTRALVARGAIEKCSRPGDRQDYFRITSDHYVGALREISRRMDKTSMGIREIADRLPTSADATQGRLQRFAEVYESVARGIDLASAAIRGDGGNREGDE